MGFYPTYHLAKTPSTFNVLGPPTQTHGCALGSPSLLGGGTLFLACARCALLARVYFSLRISRLNGWSQIKGKQEPGRQQKTGGAERGVGAWRNIVSVLEAPPPWNPIFVLSSPSSVSSICCSHLLCSTLTSQSFPNQYLGRPVPNRALLPTATQHLFPRFQSPRASSTRCTFPPSLFLCSSFPLLLLPPTVCFLRGSRLLKR